MNLMELSDAMKEAGVKHIFAPIGESLGVYTIGVDRYELNFEGEFFIDVQNGISYTAESFIELFKVGRKFDAGKRRWSLLPRGIVGKVVDVLTLGADKYDDDNWQQVDDFRNRYYSAMMRHIDAWWHGEKLDTETGIHHLAHAICNAMFLMWGDEHD